jgi:nucleoside-diphosphate-sugar epimerase
LPLIEQGGHEAVVFDVDPLAGENASEFVRGDVRNEDEVLAATRGVDLVVHTAAIHGIHLATHSARDFYDLNITGTFNVWQAAVAARVKGVVFSSTMGAYGESRRPAGDDDVVAVDEDLLLLPTDIYGYSKVVGEEMCRLHWRADGIRSVALRFGMFVPEPFFRFGIRLLYGGVDERDVAASVMAAIAILLDGSIGHEAFNIESGLPFTDDDAAVLRRDPLAALDRHFVGAAALLRDRGVTRLKPITERFVIDRAADRLNWMPRHNFAEWLNELEQRPNERASANPPWP